MTSTFTMKSLEPGPIGVSVVLYRTSMHDLDALKRSVDGVRTPLVWNFVDNSPDDTLRSDALERWPSARYRHLPHNPGYGAGHNVALRQSQRLGLAYHLVLNADIRFQPGTIDRLREFMDANPNIGQVMPRVRNPDGSLQRLCKLVPSPVDLLARRFLPPSMREARTRRLERWDTGYDRTVWTPYLSGCFMFLRVACLERVGIFDERFFMYPEDLDMTRRMAERFDTVFWPGAEIVHEHGAHSYRTIKMLRIHMWNMCKYFNKWGWFRDPGRKQLNQRARTMPIPFPCVEPPDESVRR